MTKRFKKILYTTNLAPESKYVFEYVKKMVASTGAIVTVVHVLEDVSSSTDEILTHFLGKKNWEKFNQDKLEHVKSLLIGKIHETQIVRDAIGCFLECMNNEDENTSEDDIIVAKGNPSDVILELAEKNDCEIIVAGREKHALLGIRYVRGTLKEIIRKSAIPVLVVPYEKEEGAN